MSGTETGGLMTSTEQFTVAGVQNSPANVPSRSSAVVPNMCMPYGSGGDNSNAATAVYQQMSAPPPYQVAAEGGSVGVISRGANNNNSSEQVKRKRGRPRKYGPDGSMALSLMTVASPLPVPQASFGGAESPLGPAVMPQGPAVMPQGPAVMPQGPAVMPQGPAVMPLGPAVTPLGPSVTSSAGPNPSRKPRGRPPGSSTKKQKTEAAAGSTSSGITPHVLDVKPGEDVSAHIMAFCQNGPSTVCVMSGSGEISNVTLRQTGTSGGTATYEGRFVILCLSGSFMLSEICGQRRRTGGLSVSLAGSDGRFISGGVVGLLTAASPVQVIIGSFPTDDGKESTSAHLFDSTPALGGLSGANSSPSRGTHSESSGGPVSPLNQSTPACTNSNLQGVSSMSWK